MKQNRTRLIALLLALCLLMGALPTLAFAENSIQTMDDYQNARARVEEALAAPDVPIEQTNQYLVTRTSEASSIVTDPIEGEIVAGAANEFTLPVARKLILTTAEAAEAYRWQIRIGDEWANIVGDTENKITLTYAKLQNALSGDAAYVRCALTRAGETVYTDEALVRVSTEVETESAPVTEQIPVTSYYQPSPVSRAKQLNANVQANEEKDTFSIIINYNFENGTQAANPWTATIAKGSAYATTVTSPTVVGYKPDKDIVELKIDNIQKDITETVTYSPAEVDYTVKHYQQNVSNDDYTLVDTETKTGFTEAAVGGELAKTYTGFYSLLYDTTTKIAADGSTEVEIYYDRNYYLMSFNLDGGYGVEPIYARYGAKIEVGTPTKAGYTFTGWDKDIPETMPAANTSYKAKWQVGDSAKVTIVVWGENANDEGYSFYKNAEIMATPGEKLTLKELQGKLICGKEEHTHSEACGIVCTHTHSLTCYGLSQNASSTNPNDNTALWCDSKPETYFAQLGLEDGYLYYDDENAALDSKNNYYLRYGGKYYNLEKWQFKNLKGTEVGKTSDNTSRNPDYYYKYEVKTSGMSCPHQHSDNCYACGEIAHTHTSACYYNTSFMEEPELWKLVRSDEVTVAADGTTILNVYYDRVEFTLHFRKKNSNQDTYGTIQKKWGANIRTEFNSKCQAAGTSNWSENKDASGPWTSYLDIMPKKNRTYYAYTKGTGTSTAYYYVEGLDGKDELFYTNTSTGSGYTVTEEEFIEIEGFTFNKSRSAKVGDGFNGAKFYYTRNSYNLKFFNYSAEVAGKGGSVKYEAPLSGYNFTPDYPAGLEPNAYVFDGWYTTAGCYEGSKADLTTMTMPASDVILYAKWAPKTHTVTFAKTEGAEPEETQTVAHGEKAKEYTTENGNYTFVGWFYKDEDGVEHAFDLSMAVRRDMNLYAKWRATEMASYIIHYQLQDGTPVADDTKGSALDLSTKTFYAKGGSDLNKDYQSGYFPETNSHSITMDINGTNEYTFIYIPVQKVNYTVRYLEKGTETVLHEEKTDETSNAVITETFVAITGYAPDAYQKRLVLSANEEENVITFLYTKDDVHAPVQIIHLTQNIVGDGYTEYQSSTNLNGVIGNTYTENPLTLPGFTYNDEKSTASGQLTKAGLVLKLYYDRIEYPYAFKFLEQGTDKELAEPVTGNARYQAQVTQTAKPIPGYTLASAENQAINIAIEDPANVVSKNVKIFYYTEQTVNIEYKVVGPEGCGTLDSYQESPLKVISGTAAGSTPTAVSGFKFVGWFKDEACTESVNETWVANTKLTPEKTKNYGTTEDPVMGYEAATYYAKFEYDTFDLTIKKKGLIQNTDEDAESAIFTVSGGNQTWTVVCDKDNEYSVTLTGLKCGTEYTVTEQDGWTWRYEVNTVTVNGEKVQTAVVNNTTGGTTELTFTNTLSNPYWLGGDNFKTNVFGTGTGN